jgi:hypothetical protein
MKGQDLPMRSILISVAVAFGACACGSDSATPQNADGTGGADAGNIGSGGTGGTGGTGGGGTGGTPEVGSETVRGAVSVHILKKAGCSLSEQFQDFPPVASGHPVSDIAKTTVEDGGTTADGQPVAVICDWLGSQAPYSFTAVMTIGPDGARRRISLGAAIHPKESVSDGVGLATPDWSAQYGSNAGTPCVYKTIAVDEATRSVWGSFTCPDFSPRDGSDSCSTGESYFAFEHCTLPTL